MTPNPESGFKPGIEPGNDLPWVFLGPSALFGERLHEEGRGAGAGGSGGVAGFGGILRSFALGFIFQSSSKTSNQYPYTTARIGDF
jgi:hypothetical protein